jgi:hypothetical protein
MTVKQIKILLEEKDEKISGTKKQLENRFQKVYNIPENVKNPLLYYAVRERIKRRVKNWPSIYASNQVITEYKRDGGKFKGKATDLDKWCKEHWTNICEKNNKNNEQQDIGKIIMKEMCNK